MLISEFSQALDINPFPGKNFCNTFEVIHMKVDILNDDKCFGDEDESGFTGSFSKKMTIPE